VRSAEEPIDILETATKYGLKLIEAARANTNAAFDFAAQSRRARE
jgi:hypothetical protein